MRTSKLLALAVLCAIIGSAACDSDKPKDQPRPAPPAAPATAPQSAATTTTATTTAVVTPPAPASRPTVAAAAGDLIDLPIKLPLPAYTTTPKKAPDGLPIEKPRVGLRAPTKGPKGAVNLALRKPVTGSDKDPKNGTLDLITDGDKEAGSGNTVEIAPGVQWVQIDLGQPGAIHAIALWHEHGGPAIYHAVIVQVSDDLDFIDRVTTAYSNDRENAAGQGTGTEPGFWETFEGKVITIPGGVTGRYVRLYSNGNTNDDRNRYTEVEVWGLPAAR